MVMEENNNESCGSRASDTSSTSSPPPQHQSRQHRQKLGVYNEVLGRLKESNNDEAIQPRFDDELWTHFNRLPTRYGSLPYAFTYEQPHPSTKIDFLFSFFTFSFHFHFHSFFFRSLVIVRTRKASPAFIFPRLFISRNIRRLILFKSRVKLLV